MGLPGSGKTYLAKRFSKIINAEWLNADKIRGKYNNWGDINKMGAAFAVLLLPIFYGYIIKLITMCFSKLK